MTALPQQFGLVAARLRHVLHVLRSLASVVRRPSTRRRYFSRAAATRTRWTWLRESGWCESPNDTTLYFNISARGADGEYFYVCAYMDDSLRLMMDDVQRAMTARRKVVATREQLDSYLDPVCRCKTGWHWRCELHRTWRN